MNENSKCSDCGTDRNDDYYKNHPGEDCCLAYQLRRELATEKAKNASLETEIAEIMLALQTIKEFIER